MGSSTLLRKRCFQKSVLVLLLLCLLPSCAIRYKGIKGINSISKKSSVTLTDETVTKLPDHYLGYYKGEDKVTPLLFEKDPEATWIIQSIKYEQVPFGPMCGTGLVMPVLVSWATFGIIPIHLTQELKGNFTIKNKRTDEIKNVKFHAKKTTSYSLWNKLKIGKDPEWTGKEKLNNDEYFRSFIESKFP